MDLHGPDLFHRRHDVVSGHDGADSFRSSRADDVAGIERIKRGGQFDQLRHGEYQVARIRLLAHLPVDRDAEIEGSGVGNFVGGDQPRAQHRVAVRRFAEAAIFRASYRNVETDRISRHIIQRIFAANIIGVAADDKRQLHLVVVTPLQMTQRNAVAGTDQRTAGLRGTDLPAGL